MYKFIQRNQKKMLAVFGVVLMIAFIIPSTFKNGGAGRGDQVIGKVGDVKVLGDEIFGAEAFASEIIWRYRRWPSKTPNFQRVHDVLLRWRKDPKTKPRFNTPYVSILLASALGELVRTLDQGYLSLGMGRTQRPSVSQRWSGRTSICSGRVGRPK